MLDLILLAALITTLAAFALPTRRAPEAAPPDTRTEVQQIIAALEAGQTGGMATMPEVL